MSLEFGTEWSEYKQITISLEGNRCLFSCSGHCLYRLHITLVKNEDVVKAHAPHREEDGCEGDKRKLIHSNVKMGILKVLYFVVITWSYIVQIVIQA